MGWISRYIWPRKVGGGGGHKSTYLTENESHYQVAMRIIIVCIQVGECFEM